MPRPGLTPDMLAALQAPYLQPVLFVMITFLPGPVYVWSGVGDTTWNGQTWQGLGNLLGLSVTEEGTNVEARGITITISGLDSTMLGNCLNELVPVQPVTAYLALKSGGSIIDTPIVTWSGYTDQPAIDVTPHRATITLNCENRILELNTPADRRYTQEDCASDPATVGDLGFQFVNSLQEKNLWWGIPTNGTITGNNI